jgi:hypothetical protein
MTARLMTMAEINDAIALMSSIVLSLYLMSCLTASLNDHTAIRVTTKVSANTVKNILILPSVLIELRLDDLRLTQ